MGGDPAAIGGRVMQAGKDYLADKPGLRIDAYGLSEEIVVDPKTAKSLLRTEIGA